MFQAVNNASGMSVCVPLKAHFTWTKQTEAKVSWECRADRVWPGLVACAVILTGRTLHRVLLWDRTLIHAETLSQKKEIESKERGNKAESSEGSWSLILGFQKRSWVSFWCRWGKLLLFYFLKLSTVSWEFKRNTGRQTSWRSQRKTVRALARKTG